MKTYGLMALPDSSLQKTVRRFSDGACIPFDPANNDYANFKEQILTGEAELHDFDGNTMSPEAAQTFVKGLP